MKKEIIGIVMVLFSLIFISFASASVSVSLNDSTISTRYAPGQNISGRINLTIVNENTDALLRTNFNDKLNLLDLVRMIGIEYSCTPTDCNSNYNAQGEDVIKSFSLNTSNSKILGFKLEGEISSIGDLSLKINSSAQESCFNPLKIDLLDNNETNWIFSNSTNDFSCSQEHGCFDSQEVLTEYNIGKSPYCEKIFLEQKPKFMVGAWVKKGTTAWSNGLLKMQIYSISDTQSISKGSCNLPEPSSSGGEISCPIDFSAEQGGYYHVCIVGTGNNNIDEYKIRTENKNPCGFYNTGQSSVNYTRDYDIFARGARFASIGSVDFNKNVFLPKGTSISNYLTDYITLRYNKQCTNGCVIPIKFISGTDQNLDIWNIKLDYITSSGGLTLNKIADIQKIPGKISFSGIVNLDNLGFKVPQTIGNQTIEFYVGDQKIKSDMINIISKAVIEDVYPKTTAAQLNTKFYAVVSSEKNITSYKWEFGDSGQADTNVNYAVHKYGNIGNYSLKLTIRDSLGETSFKTIDINVQSPKDIINSSLKTKKLLLDNLTSDLNKMDSWKSGVIKNKINFSNLDEGLRNIEKDYLQASSDSDYVNIMSRLNDLKIPVRIETSNVASAPLIILFKNIDSDKLKQLGAGNPSPGSYDDSIKSWFLENLDGSVASETILFNYGAESEAITTFFKAILRTKKTVGETYFVVNKDVSFKNSGAKTFVNSKGIALPSISDVEFSSNGLVQVQSLEAYLSPKFSELKVVSTTPCNFNKVCESELGENKGNCKSDCKSYTLAIFLAILVFFAGLGIYIFLQEWYKRRYEDNLFTDSRELNNLFNYIGLNINTKSEKEIARELHKAGWNIEQIAYSIKKFKGERTGMWEIPIPEALKFWERKQESNERQESRIPKPIPLPQFPTMPAREFKPIEEQEERQDKNQGNQPQGGFRSGFKPFKTD